MTTVQSSTHPVSWGREASAVAPASVPSQPPRGVATTADPFARRPGAEVPPSAEQRLLAAAGSENMLEAMQVFARECDRDAGVSGIHMKRESMEQARRLAEAAMRRAAEAGKKRGAWGAIASKLSTVAKVAAVVAAAASVVATGGASAVAIVALSGTLMSTFSKQLSSTLGTGDTGATVFAIGGAALAGGAGVASLVSSGSQAAAAGAKAGDAAAATLNNANQAAGGAGKAAGIAEKAMAVAAKAKDLAPHIERAAQTVSATTTAHSAVAGAVSAHYAKKEAEATSDEKALRAQRKAMRAEMQMMIDMLKEVEESHTKALGLLADTRAQKAAADLTLCSGIRG